MEERKVENSAVATSPRVTFARWTTRFKEVHVPLRFYLSSWKTNFRGSSVAPSFASHLVTRQSVPLRVSASAPVTTSVNSWLVGKKYGGFGGSWTNSPPSVRVFRPFPPISFNYPRSLSDSDRLSFA